MSSRRLYLADIDKAQGLGQIDKVANLARDLVDEIDGFEDEVYILEREIDNLEQKIIDQNNKVVDILSSFFNENSLPSFGLTVELTPEEAMRLFEDYMRAKHGR